MLECCRSTLPLVWWHWECVSILCNLCRWRRLGSPCPPVCCSVLCLSIQCMPGLIYWFVIYTESCWRTVPVFTHFACSICVYPQCIQVLHLKWVLHLCEWQMLGQRSMCFHLFCHVGVGNFQRRPLRQSAGIVLTSIVSHLFSRYSTSLILRTLAAMGFSRFAEVFDIGWRRICLHCIYVCLVGVVAACDNKKSTSFDYDWVGCSSKTPYIVCGAAHAVSGSLSSPC